MVDASSLDRSLLELLHPLGKVRHALVLGNGAPAGLHSDAPETGAEERPDLVLVAPDRVQGASASWARETARIAASVADNGVVYLVASARARRRLTDRLRRRGLVPTGSFVHVPNTFEPRFLVPLERAPVAYATTELMPLRRPNRRLASLVRRLPSLGPVNALATPVGTVLRPPRAAQLFDWARPSSVTGPFQAIVVRGRSPRRFTLIVFGQGDSEPRAVVKVVPDEEQARKLADQLARFGPAAAAAGATTPEVVDVGLGGKPALVETVVPGTSAYSFLLDRPQRVPAVLEPLASWVGSWNRSTATSGSVTPDLLERRVWAPLRSLEPQLGDPRALHAVLERVCRAAEGEPCSLVATHGDLTMANVLLSRGGVGVVDWEHGEPDGLPLTDFLYAAADAAAAVRGYADRIAAARACLEPGGRHAALVGRLRAELVRQLGLSPAVEELCFLACWLHHAANEARAADGTHYPFRGLLEWATRRRPAGA